jgi:serine/threonine-protein kinase
VSSTPETIGRYAILNVVGKGGMGVLYRAHDAVLERDVALKMMLVDFSHDTAARERFQREARAVARLQHRNVVTIHELGEVEGTPYIVMEFLGGRDLDALLKEGADLTLAKKLEIAAQVCEGLAYAHEQGIVHRDIKPGNVRVLDDGTVKILDFGIAKFAMSSVTQTGTVMGTPSYMAPEQIMGQGIDGRSDLFSAGVLLYELLSGNKPFQGDSPTAVVYQIMNGEPVPLRESIPGLPEAIDDIIGHALQKNPEERYATAKQMATDLQAVRAMIDPQLHTGHTPVLGMPSTGKTAQLSVPLFATQRVRPSTGDDIPLNTGIRPPTIA